VVRLNEMRSYIEQLYQDQYDQIERIGEIK
jgi:hypothetical protein